ncbi:MAG: DNA-binding HxlR family transcriptional regulator [Hyphomicrobiaceae bacterium]|jgi:DNA-binding HxlR family transcriptional regulator
MALFRYDQSCPVARAAEVLGERWTLLLIRELLCGPKRFADLRSHLPGISTSVLTARLEALEARNVLRHFESPPPAPASLYELTPFGRGLAPVLREVARWGIGLLRNDSGGHFEPEWSLLAINAFNRTGPSPRIGIALEIKIGEAIAYVQLNGGPRGTRVARAAATLAASSASRSGNAPTTARITGEILMALISGGMSTHDALAAGTEVSGDVQIFHQLPALFDLVEIAEAHQESATE